MQEAVASCEDGPVDWEALAVTETLAIRCSRMEHCPSFGRDTNWPGCFSRARLAGRRLRLTGGECAHDIRDADAPGGATTMQACWPCTFGHIPLDRQKAIPRWIVSTSRIS
jgi:hypothetical protein